MSSAMSMGAINDFLASNMAFSALPPMPTPSMPGGHHPAPISGTISNTQSATESEGFNMANMDLFSDPPPLGRHRDLEHVTGCEFRVDHRRCVVPRIGAFECRI